MKIQYCSDLHLEFSQNRIWLEKNPLIPVGEILLIAGDTFYLGPEFNDLPFFDFVSNEFEFVYIIPGNHEYYSGFDSKIGLEIDFKSEIRKNVHLVNNTRIVHGDVDFFFQRYGQKLINKHLRYLNQ